MALLSKYCIVGITLILASIGVLWGLFHSRHGTKIQDILPASNEIESCTLLRSAVYTENWGNTGSDRDVKVEIAEKDIVPFFGQFRNIVIDDNISMEREVFIELEYEYEIICKLSKDRLAEFSFSLVHYEDHSRGVLSYSSTTSQNTETWLIKLELKEAQELDALLAKYMSN